MSIISSIKKAFGFPEEYEEPDYNESDSSHESDDVKDNEFASTTLAPQEIEQETDTVQLSGAIFDSVIELFNATQPEFVKECLSQDSQRQYILERMNQDVKVLLEKEVSIARAKGEKLWRAERKKLADDLEAIKTDFNTIKSQRDEFRNAQLSETRQKRALKDRIKDLETKVTTLEAEKEQFQLENRSMVNKLRVANVRSNGNADEEAEIMRLATENVKLQDNINLLRDKLSASDAEIKHLQSELDSEDDLDELKEIEEQIKQFEIIKEKKDAKISALNKTVKQKEQDITQLKSIISEHENVTAKLHKEIQSLRNTIESNLRSHAISEDELRQQIEKLTPKPIEDHAPQTETDKNEPEKRVDVKSPEQTEAKPKSEIKISVIDELMENTDWFVAPTPTPIKKKSDIDDTFGYKEPVRKPTRDNDNQLSLWD
ncbi:MAG: hypothetical protein K2M94_05205 [Paramuribaculum sp.]|nr:hypothetical protein [Paramuribaculum sp.]